MRKAVKCCPSSPNCCHHSPQILIDQGEGVGGEGVEVVGTDDRRGGVAAQPWRNDAVGLGEVLEERDGGRRVIGEAVEEEERARVDRAADERVNLAERQRERGAGQPLMRCVHKSDQRCEGVSDTHRFT